MRHVYKYLLSMDLSTVSVERVLWKVEHIEMTLH